MIRERTYKDRQKWVYTIHYRTYTLYSKQWRVFIASRHDNLTPELILSTLSGM
jgi:hypothetical protein